MTKGYSLRQSASCCQASWGLGVLLVQTPALRPILLEMVPLPVADSIQCKVLRTYFLTTVYTQAQLARQCAVYGKPEKERLLRKQRPGLDCSPSTST